MPSSGERRFDLVIILRRTMLLIRALFPRLRWASLLGLLVLCLGGLCACGSAAPRAHHPLEGKPLRFSLPDLQGKPVTPEQLRGRVVLVDIWATWCKPCGESLPIYARLWRELEPQGLTVLAVSIDEDDAQLAGYLREHPLPFTVLRDPEQTLPASIKAEAMPTALLLGRDGRIRYVHSSFRSGDGAIVEAEIRRAVSEPDSAGGVDR